MANSRSKTRRKFLIFSGIVFGLAGMGLYAFIHKPEALITVQAEKVGRRSLTELVTATGKIQPVVYVKISPEVSGEIIELPAKEGQLVNKGELLMKVKPDIYIASRNSAEASFRSAQAQDTLAKAQRDKAEAEYQRNQNLFESKLISDSQFLEAKTAYEVAKASYQAALQQTANAKAALARAEEDLSKTTIYSPLCGTISQLNSHLGERVVGTAMYQGTDVMTISDLNEMEARVDIGEIDVVLIKVGQKTRLEVDAFQDRKFKGVVTDIANTAKGSALGTQQEATKFEVRIRVQEKEAFRPGMSVTAEIETRMRTNVLTVPIQSVTTRMPKETGAKPRGATSAQAAKASDQAKTNTPVASASTTNATAPSLASNTASSGKKANEAPKPIEVVFLVDGGKAKMVPVKRGISDDAYVEIESGLKENQEVVSGGYKAINRELEDGKKIKVDNTKKGQDKEGKPEGTKA